MKAEERSPDMIAGPYEVYIKWGFLSVMGADESMSDVRVFERRDGKLVRRVGIAVTHKDGVPITPEELVLRALVGDVNG